jgi:UMF1 family MFS transporter
MKPNRIAEWRAQWSHRAHASTAPGVRLIEVWAWAMYDFANSGYTTVVITAMFNAYFVALVAGNQAWATFAWTTALAVSYALITVLGPVIGAFADAYTAKKRLLKLSTVGCVAFTAALALVGPGDVALGVALIILSNFFFGTGENLIAAFLPELATADGFGRISGWGWSLGYLGGLLSLGVCLVYVTWAQGQGQGSADFVPITMLITAALFAAASLPTFLFLKERGNDRAVARPAVSTTFSRLWSTLRYFGKYRDLRRFLICLLFYQAGVLTVVALAAVYAEQAMRFTTQQSLMLILIVNVTASVGAFAFGHVQDKLGHILAIALTLCLWILTVILAWRAQTVTAFWVTANTAGIALGASQSAGRALVAYLSPFQRRAEFFGLWGLATKLASILGPMTYGSLVWLSGGDHRLAMLMTGSYFVLGLLVLMTVDAQRGRGVAMAEDAQTSTSLR